MTQVQVHFERFNKNAHTEGGSILNSTSFIQKLSCKYAGQSASRSEMKTAPTEKKKKRLKNAIRTFRGWNNNSNNKNQRNVENAVWAFSLIKNILRDLNIQPSLTANSLIEEETQFNRESLISVLWKSRVKNSVVLLSRQVLLLTDLVERIFPRWWGNTETKQRNFDTTLDLECRPTKRFYSIIIGR